MYWWNLYANSTTVMPGDDEGRGDGEGDGEEGRNFNSVEEAKETQATHSQGSMLCSSSNGVAPSIADLDPRVTAAILTQAAFRGYRLRHRLQRLPAREAERTIRALHTNAHGFRRIALFLLFVGLFFSLVFGGADVAFQRTVHQGLKNHLAMARYGAEKDRSHTDVASLSDVYQWMQAFYLTTYHGSQREDQCTACIVKPPDDVCISCDFDIYNAEYSNWTRKFTNDSYTFDGQARTDSGAKGSSSSSSGGGGGSSSGGGGSSSDSGFGRRSSIDVSKQCEMCVIGRFCTGLYLENCARSLSADYTSPPDQEDADTPDGESSASPSTSPVSNSSVELTINTTALSALELEPVGGVTAAGGDLVVDNVDQCSNFDANVGVTENVARFAANLSLLFNGEGYVANRNRIIGGMLIRFTRRVLLENETCKASRGYFDICLADKENTETIVPGGSWPEIRPDFEVKYNQIASAYSILIDTGGYNTGLNRGLCSLMVMEDLDLIPPDDVKSVSVQLVTYNGNQKSAFGSISIDFKFEDGGAVTVTDIISAYLLKRNTAGSSYRGRWISIVLFVSLFVGMVWSDTSKWWRLKRYKKAKRKREGNCYHRVCGFTFFVLIFVNMLMWLEQMWRIGLSRTIMYGTEDTEDQIPDIDMLAQEVVSLYRVGLFISTYYFVFLVTAMTGLYRWIFQILTFHKRMSIVADTLSRASTHLHHFLFVSFLVVVVFANLTYLLAGSGCEHFSTLGEAWRSAIRVSLGEYNNFYPQILAAQPTVGPVIVVLYQVLAVILLLNVVIAILVEAYGVVVEGMKDEDTVFESLEAFVGMTLCLGKARIQWANDYVRWRLSDPAVRQERRPSLKVSLQGPNSVCGVDGRPVLLIRRSSGFSLNPAKRQLSFNCPRYISVTEMQVLIKAAPVPEFVAKRLVRKIVDGWIFRSTERISKDAHAPMSLVSNGHSIISGDGTMNPIPTLRPRNTSTSDPR